jgi:hypothetical protein
MDYTKMPTPHHLHKTRGEMKGSRRMHCDEFASASASLCIFCRAAAVNGRHPGTIGSRHMVRGGAHVVTPTATRDGEKQQATEPASTLYTLMLGPWALRALAEPAIGCGYDRSALAWPCTTAQRAWLRSGCPKTMVCGISPTTTRPGLQTNREADRPPTRPQFLVAMSFRHSANCPDQAAGKGFDDTASARCIVNASRPLPP